MMELFALVVGIAIGLVYGAVNAGKVKAKLIEAEQKLKDRVGV